MRRKRGRPAVADGPVTLASQTGFENEIETMTITSTSTADMLANVRSVSSGVSGPSSPLGQVSNFKLVYPNEKYVF
jgi:hypothetical protein